MKKSDGQDQAIKKLALSISTTRKRSFEKRFGKDAEEKKKLFMQPMLKPLLYYSYMLMRIVQKETNGNS